MRKTDRLMQVLRLCFFCFSFIWLLIGLGYSQPSRVYTYTVPATVDDGWETSSLQAEGLDAGRINQLMQKIVSGEFQHYHSIVIVKNGKLVLDEYFGGYNPDRIHTIQSATKSIASILTGIALDRGVITSLDEKVYTFFPNRKGTIWVDKPYTITLKHALTMTAGLDWDERTYPYGDPRNANTAMNRSDDWIDFILNTNMAEPPGTRFNYTSGLSVLLGAVIQNSSELETDKFAAKYLFGPLGISEYHWYKSRRGTIHTGGGLHLRPRDMAKIGYMLASNGRWQGRQIVSRSYIAEATRAHVQSGGYGYGYQWWTGKTVTADRLIHAYWAWGRGGQFILVFRELNLVVVFTAKYRDNPDSSRRTFTILSDYILPAVVKKPPKRMPGMSERLAWKKYVGTYAYSENSREITVSIFVENDRLYGREEGDGASEELIMIGAGRYYCRPQGIGDCWIEFIRDENGAVNSFEFKFDRRFIFTTARFIKRGST
jgi:CubicO group peptidase (beta-lactamase class C family)